MGGLDGKHCQLTNAPAHSGTLYYNYKKLFIVILLALVNSNYEFIWVYIGTNRSWSDAQVYNGSSLCQAIKMRGIQ